MEKFESIGQFRDVIKSVNDHCEKFGKEKPTLKFVGTVKIHGTNAAVNVDRNDNMVFQSRERELSIESDNAGFCMWGNRNKDILMQTIQNVRQKFTNFSTRIVIYGEWCGPGVQKGVAVSQIPNKIFVIFNITIIVDEENRFELNPTQIGLVTVRSGDIFTAYDFPTWEIDIDFNSPQTAQNRLVDLTLAVEEECPVGKHFGISGIGEGIVWWNPETNLKMKVKGEKHSVSKVKTVKQIAAVDLERMASVQEFVDSVMTENRLNQGLAKLSEMGLDNTDIKNTGAFIKWCVGDVLKEEGDLIVASNLDMKEVNPKLSEKAKNFWFTHINKV